jgi:hypothetical protein
MLDDGWLAELRAQGVRRVASALGFSVDEAPRRGLRPCPSCEATTRGKTDRRAPAELTSDGNGWHCYPCSAKGTVVTLAALSVLQTNDPKREDWRTLREALSLRGLLGAPPAPPRAQAPETPLRPPPSEVAALWRSCVPVADDPEVAAFLRSRHLDPDAVDLFRLARALPHDATLPSWAACRGRSWTETFHRLVLPMAGDSSECASVHVRAIAPFSDFPKGLSPRGFGIAGLAMADPLARLMLTGRPLADGSDSADLVRQSGLIITEGVPDFLGWGTRWSDTHQSAPATLGIVSGSFSAALAARIPDGCRVAVRRHADKAGEKYTEQIIAALAGRCRIHVRKVDGAPDVQG